MRTVFPNTKRREFRDDYEITDFVNVTKGMKVTNEVTVGDLNEMVEGESRISKQINAVVTKSEGKLYKQVAGADGNITLQEV